MLTPPPPAPPSKGVGKSIDEVREDALGLLTLLGKFITVISSDTVTARFVATIAPTTTPSTVTTVLREEKTNKNKKKNKRKWCQ